MDTLHFLIDFIVHIDHHLNTLVSLYGLWVYFILFLIVFSETGLVVTPFLPGDSLLFVAGALAASQSQALDIYLLCVIFIVAAILGNMTNYAIGRFFGLKLFSNKQSKIFRYEYLSRTQAFYEKHGGKTLILARFMPIVRTFAPFVAGMASMSYLSFMLYNMIGSLLWVFIFCVSGFLFGNLPFVRQNLELFILAIIILSCLPAIIEFWRHKRRFIR